MHRCQYCLVQRVLLNSDVGGFRFVHQTTEMHCMHHLMNCVISSVYSISVMNCNVIMKMFQVSSDVVKVCRSPQCSVQVRLMVPAAR